ncbi:MAG: cation:proton antiporter [Undibacterium sp.]
MSLEVVLAVAVLMLICIGTYFVAGRLKLPYTVLLVIVGSILVPLTHFEFFHFIKSFELTPELLFFVFLPVLIFESAYNMNMREMAENVRSISWLSVVSLIVSAFFVAIALFWGLRLIGFPVPFMATLVFGALISATDPVAVLALFKEFGVPRRLSLIFEGESLFNDGTSLALFLIVLDVAMAGFSGLGSILEGVFMFTTMVLGGGIFGLLMGFIFSKIIGKVQDNEHVEITLTMLVAHLTFILSELISHHLVLFGQEIKFSSIIATVMASMVIGNYGRFKISPRVEEYMEKFWGYFAFVANSLVFILMGLLFADLPIHFDQFIVPMLITVVVVMVGRALSIYPVVALVNRFKKEEPIPMSWQHLLAWGSLRGALAVTMVLLIPDSFTLPGWAYDFTVKEFIAAITIGCIYFTLCIKATTIGTMIKKMKLSDLTVLETVEYHECAALVYQEALEKLDDFHEKGYVKSDVFARLKQEYTERYEKSAAACKTLFTATPGDMGRALQMYALGMEKRFLRELYVYQEISESEYKEILNKIAIQTARVEEGKAQVSGHAERFEQDWFETLVMWFRKKFRPKPAKQEMLEEYRYYRAQEVVLAKVLRRLKSLSERFPGLYGDEVSTEAVVALYEGLRVDAEKKRDGVAAKIGTELAYLNESFGRYALFKTEERMLDELLENAMLPRKVGNMLYNELKDETYSI